MASKPTTMMASRGAMFGLDARITLFVFGLLSTVTGFVLYQRAEEVQDIKIYANIQEIELALKLMQRDLGTMPRNAVYDDDTSWDFQFSMLCDSNAIKANFRKLWKGPYISKIPCNNSDVYKANTIGYLLAWARATGVSSTVPPQNGANICTATSDCYAWIGIEQAPAALFTYINRVVDEQGGVITEVSPQSNGRVTFYNTNVIWYRTEVHK